jgi:hypothetical protein
MKVMPTRPSIRWKYGGHRECQVCGVEHLHCAVLAIPEREISVYLCRDCAEEARGDLAAFLRKLIPEPGGG